MPWHLIIGIVVLFLVVAVAFMPRRRRIRKPGGPDRYDQSDTYGSMSGGSGSDLTPGGGHGGGDAGHGGH